MRSRRRWGLWARIRPGWCAPDAVTALWKDGHLPRLELQPVDEALRRIDARVESFETGLHQAAVVVALWLRGLLLAGLLDRARAYRAALP